MRSRKPHINRQKGRIWTEFISLRYRHRRMDSKFPCFILARAQLPCLIHPSGLSLLKPVNHLSNNREYLPLSPYLSDESNIINCDQEICWIKRNIANWRKTLIVITLGRLFPLPYTFMQFFINN
jgi:hypothetical protein